MSKKSRSFILTRSAQLLTFRQLEVSVGRLLHLLVVELEVEVFHGPQDGQHALDDVAEHHGFVEQALRLVETLHDVEGAQLKVEVEDNINFVTWNTNLDVGLITITLFGIPI